MTRYVAGFLFSTMRSTVALIEKNRPEWQRGKLNAVGGKIEVGENSYQAMRREFHEETGLAIDDWNHYCTLSGEGFIVFFFRAFSPYLDLWKIQSPTDEEIVLCSVNALPESVLPNVPWLMHMALSMDKDRATLLKVKEAYA